MLHSAAKADQVILAFNPESLKLQLASFQDNWHLLVLTHNGRATQTINIAETLKTHAKTPLIESKLFAPFIKAKYN